MHARIELVSIDIQAIVRLRHDIEVVVIDDVFFVGQIT